MWNEFKQFLQRGNVLDLAVAVIVGNAFSAIVKSLVDDLFMPVVGVLVGGINFSKLVLKVGAATITYGNFLQAIVNFLIIAFALFLVVRGAARLEKQKTKEQEAASEPPLDVQLLTEIRDLLKESR
ncbi:MAG: large-conductance mechanosensitive channel protein MscL [Anaerolineales bacterium]